MPAGLTYLSQKAIVQYLEANLRIHLSSRCSSLRKLERQTHLKMETLTFHDNSVIINGTTYELKSSTNALFALFSTRPVFKIDPFKNMKNMLAYLLDKRDTVRVRILIVSFRIRKSFRLPENLKLHAKFLDYGHPSFSNFSKHLNPTCYPLRQLKCYIGENDDDYNYSQVTNNLVVLNKEHNESLQNVLRQQDIRIINLKNLRLSRVQLGDVLRAWRTGGRRIGTRLTMYYSGKSEMRQYESVLRGVKRDFGGTMSILDSSRNRDWTEITHCNAFQFNEQSSLVTYASSGEVRMEIVSLERACPWLWSLECCFLIFLASIFAVLLMMGAYAYFERNGWSLDSLVKLIGIVIRELMNASKKSNRWWFRF